MNKKKISSFGIFFVIKKKNRLHLIIWFGYMKLFQRREKAINIRADEFIQQQQKNIAAMRPFIRREAGK